jgi:Xaa-Pro aminopeptidase
MTTFLPALTSAHDIPERPDIERMRRQTGARLRSAMADRGVDALILLGNNSVVYATGVSWPLGDAGLSYVERPVAVVLADDPHPHLFLPFREGSAQVIEELVPAAAVIAVDELTGAMRRAQPRLFRSGRPVDAAQIVGAAKLIKTPDEVACIRTAVRITDTAMVDVQAALAPGIRQIDLSASFMRRAFELGAMASMLEPIWQVMPKYKADGVWTTHGDLALPLLTTERKLAAGDVLWTDVSITYQGYCSDFGRTWVVGDEPTPRQHAQYYKWQEIMDAVLSVVRAGASLADLGRAATKADGGTRPWLPHFYLGHSIGVNAAETPMIGTDLGEEFDENFILEPGMVMVLEPVVWEDGTGGYRSEEIIVITEDGHIRLTDYPYAPYGEH